MTHLPFVAASYAAAALTIAAFAVSARHRLRRVTVRLGALDQRSRRR